MTEKKESLDDFSQKVDHDAEIKTEQSIQPALPSENEVDQKNNELTELVGFIRTAIAENDREFAKDIQVIITETCGRGVVDRTQVWAALTAEEQAALTALLKPHYPLPITQSEIAPETELIDPIDAQKIRDIALIWWDEYFPEHTQSLITQMFGWQSPGQKYSQTIINQWLETEDDLVRDRITQLFSFNNGSSTSEETP